MENSAIEYEGRSKPLLRYLALLRFLASVIVVISTASLAPAVYFEIKLAGRSAEGVVSESMSSAIVTFLTGTPVAWLAMVLLLVGCLGLLGADARRLGLTAIWQKVAKPRRVAVVVAMALIHGTLVSHDYWIATSVSDARYFIRWGAVVLLATLVSTLLMARFVRSVATAPPFNVAGPARSHLRLHIATTLATALALSGGAAFALRSEPPINEAYEELAFEELGELEWTTEEVACLDSSGLTDNERFMVDNGFDYWETEAEVRNTVAAVQDCLGARRYLNDYQFDLALTGSHLVDVDDFYRCFDDFYESPDWAALVISQLKKDTNWDLYGRCRNLRAGASDDIVDQVMGLTKDLADVSIMEGLAGIEQGDDEAIIVFSDAFDGHSVFTMGASFAADVTTIEDERFALFAAGIDVLYPDLDPSERNDLLIAAIEVEDEVVLGNRKYCRTQSRKDKKTLFLINVSLSCKFAVPLAVSS